MSNDMATAVVVVHLLSSLAAYFLGRTQGFNRGMELARGSTMAIIDKVLQSVKQSEGQDAHERVVQCLSKKLED